MTFEEFKNTVENLDVPWKLGSRHLYCPVCMFPKEGYITCGTTLKNYFQAKPQEMENTLKYIKEFNSRVSFVDNIWIYKGDGFEVRFNKVT